MAESFRIALLLDPLSVSLGSALHRRVKWGDHAPKLAAEFLGRGHSVRGFWAPPGLIPRSSEPADPRLSGDGGAGAGTEGPGWTKLEQFQPDVLLAYDALSPAAFRATRMARKLGAALVLVEPALPNGGPWGERVLRRIGEFLWGPFVRRTAGAIVALDAVSRAHALEDGFEESLVHVIPYGVDTNEFRPGLTSRLVAQHRIRGRILLYVGRLEKSRGVDRLITAFSRTVGQRDDWNLVLCGRGAAAPALEAQARRLGVADRVHWLQRPQREELPGLMGAATLLAVPALDDGVVGRQVGRALACGLPVLVSDLPRLRHLVEDGENGLVVPPGDYDAWTEAIQRAASSPEARRRWSGTGRARAEEELGWPRVAASFEEVFVAARGRVAAKLRGAEAATSRPSPDEAPS